jgi:hypothetical protein
MFYLPIDSRHLKKAYLILALGSGLQLAYSDTAPLPDIEGSKLWDSREEGWGRFFKEVLRENTYVNARYYDGPIGFIDLFKVGNRHHWWLQAGIVPDWSIIPLGEAGGRPGYRYLFKGKTENKDSFLGGYAFATWKKRPRSSFVLPVGIGVEYATEHYQFTISGHCTIPGGRIYRLSDYREGILGLSGRISYYRSQKMHRFLGRLNPFAVGAVTRVIVRSQLTNYRSYTVEETNEDVLALNCGFGVHWELPAWVSLEAKLIWDTLKFGSLLPRLHFGFQLSFAPRDTQAIGVNQRVRKMSEHYHMDYYSTEPRKQSESREQRQSCYPGYKGYSGSMEGSFYPREPQVGTADAPGRVGSNTGSPARSRGNSSSSVGSMTLPAQLDSS